MKGAMPAEGINPIEFPESLSQLWQWFIVLNNKRPPSMAGMSPIPEAEIGWFFRNRQITLEGWELDAIACLDQAAADSNAAET